LTYLLGPRSVLQEDVAETSRNAPCPCGSGKKHKKCCLGKESPYEEFQDSPAHRISQEIFAEVHKESTAKPFASLIELNAFLQKKTLKVNQRAIPEFLGLSPEQMQGILYTPFSFDQGPVEFVLKDAAVFDNVPIIKEAIYLLNLIQSSGNLKATQKGNLPRAIVRDLWEHFHKSELYSFQPTGEDDCRQVHVLRHLLQTSGYIKKKAGKFSLTQKGQQLQGKEQLFQDLFLAAATQFNWGYGDRYSDLPLIQQALAFNLLILSQKAKTWISGKELGLTFFTAFPALEYEAIPLFGEPKEEVARCFCTRFIIRFAQPFGLIEVAETNSFPTDAKVRTTPFFLESFKLRSGPI
jgi:SEC-C motif